MKVIPADQPPPAGAPKGQPITFRSPEEARAAKRALKMRCAKVRSLHASLTTSPKPPTAQLILCMLP